MYKFIVALVAIVALLLYFAEQKPAPVAVDPALDPVIAKAKEQSRIPRHRRIDCDEAPEPAVTNDDLEESQLLHFSVECYTYGHVVGARSGYIWNLQTERHGEHFIPTPLTLAARQPGSGERRGGTPIVNHDAHFTSIAHRMMEADEVETLLDTIGKTFTTMPQPQDPSGVEILAVNNAGIEQRVLIANITEDLSVGYGCRPECEPGRLFTLTEWKTFWSVSEEERRALDVSAPGAAE